MKNNKFNIIDENIDETSDEDNQNLQCVPKSMTSKIDLSSISNGKCPGGYKKDIFATFNASFEFNYNIDD